MTQISNELECDKSTYHNYTDIYPTYVDKFKNEEFNLLEIGIDSGKSFKLWEQYFPNAKIYGIDITQSYETFRGKVFRGDQSNLSQLRGLSDLIGKCKLIIDDGSHVPEHQLKTFYHFFENNLEYGGVYIIEDIECSYWNPQSDIYGYETGYLNLIDYFTKMNHEVNFHYNGLKNNLNIHSIVFGPNCIIITKGSEGWNTFREYKFQNKI